MVFLVIDDGRKPDNPRLLWMPPPSEPTARDTHAAVERISFVRECQVSLVEDRQYPDSGAANGGTGHSPLSRSRNMRKGGRRQERRKSK
jgi:hypothetical protein